MCAGSCGGEVAEEEDVVGSAGLLADGVTHLVATHRAQPVVQQAAGTRNVHAVSAAYVLHCVQRDVLLPPQREMQLLNGPFGESIPGFAAGTGLICCTGFEVCGSLCLCVCRGVGWGFGGGPYAGEGVCVPGGRGGRGADTGK